MATTMLNLTLTFVTLSAFTLYAQEKLQGSKEGDKKKKKMTHAVCVALEVSLHAGTVIIIYNIDLLDFF